MALHVRHHNHVRSPSRSQRVSSTSHLSYRNAPSLWIVASNSWSAPACSLRGCLSYSVSLLVMCTAVFLVQYRSLFCSLRGCLSCSVGLLPPSILPTAAVVRLPWRSCLEVDGARTGGAPRSGQAARSSGGRLASLAACFGTRRAGRKLPRSCT